MYYDQKKTGERISDLIRSHGMKKDTFAEEVNAGISHVYKVCCGAEGCSIDLLVEIANYFDVTLDYLILGKTEKEAKKEEAKNRILDVIEELASIATNL